MATIFYFTGTGNSLTVARAIGKELKGNLISMSDASGLDRIFEDDVIGFVFPVYHGDIPDFTARFLGEVKIHADAYIFAVTTYGGIEGQTKIHVQSILKSRGLSLDYGARIVLPDNYLFTGTALSKREVMFSRYPEALTKILWDLKENKRNAREFEKKYHSAPSKISKKLFDTIYKVNKKKINYEKCPGCGTCEKVCPVNNISKEDGKFKIGSNCADCMACAQWCPQKAVYYGKRNAEGKYAYTHPDISLNDIMNQKSITR